MMLYNSNSGLCLVLVMMMMMMMMMVGVSSSSEYKEIFVAGNPAPATWFHPHALSFQDKTYDLYNSYFPDAGEFYTHYFFYYFGFESQ